MSLHDMTVQSAVHQHRALYVHTVAHLQLAEVRAVEGLLHRRHGVAVAVDSHHREANAVVRHALVYLQLVGE